MVRLLEKEAKAKADDLLELLRGWKKSKAGAWLEVLTGTHKIKKPKDLKGRAADVQAHHARRSRH